MNFRINNVPSIIFSKYRNKIDTQTTKVLFIDQCWCSTRKNPAVPKLPNTWWGPGEPKDGDECVKPFKINISENILIDLRHRLKNSMTLKPPLEGTKNEYGINPKLTREVVDYWLKKYDWRQRENYLNTLPQFKVKIQGLNIHFIHVIPKAPKGHRVLPLLLLHGWAGSFREFYDIIPILTSPQDGRDFVFEVVAPSLPGFGFSDPAVRTGLAAPQIAVVLKNLMLKLNKKRFFVHGGDWGAVIMRGMATLFPEHVVGMHSTFCIEFSLKAILKRILFEFFPSMVVAEKYRHLVYPSKTFFLRLIRETGYYHIQASKPETVGAALSDSPMGLAAYLLQLFLDENGELTKLSTMDTLLDNVMIYWVTNSITTSMRIYAEFHNKEVSSLGIHKLPLYVPTGYARFVNEIIYTPEAFLTRYHNLIHVSDLEGGHFAVMENPEILAADLFTFTEKVLKLKTSNSV